MTQRGTTRTTTTLQAHILQTRELVSRLLQLSLQLRVVADGAV